MAKKQFRVFVTYEVTGFTIVEADDEDEAMDLVDAGEYDELHGEEASEVTAEYAEAVED